MTTTWKQTADGGLIRVTKASETNNYYDETGHATDATDNYYDQTGHATDLTDNYYDETRHADQISPLGRYISTALFNNAD